MPEISTHHVVFTGTLKHPAYIVMRIIKCDNVIETGGNIRDNMVVTRAQHIFYRAGQK